MFALKLAGGAPLKALELLKQNSWQDYCEWFEDWLNFYRQKMTLVELSTRWAKLDVFSLLIYWKTWIYDLIYLAQGNEERVLNQTQLSVVRTLLTFCHPRKLYQFLDTLQTRQLALKEGIALNKQLLIEELLIQYGDVFFHAIH
jgi:hypothetical protein